MFKLILLSSIFALAMASCPNDCSGHGACNVYSACECYRNWMAADCSERVCYYGHAFVDTPHGDLNADGRINHIDDTFRVILGSDKSFFGKQDGTGLESTALLGRAKQTWSATDGVTVGAQRGFLEMADGGAKFSMENDITTEYTLDPAANGNHQSDDIYGYVEGCQAADATIKYSVAFDVQMTKTQADAISDNTAVAGDFTVRCGEPDESGATINKEKNCATTGTEIELKNEGGVRKLFLCSLTASTYTVQWSNRKEWESYPTDHAHAQAASGAKNVWDEAHFYRECSNKGTCNRQSGSCECYAGYEGEGCTRTTCPNDCSGHGTCRRPVDIDDAYRAWDAYKTQSCKCDSGYTGPDCSLRVCPSGDDPITRINDKNEIQRVTLAKDTDVHTFGAFEGLGLASVASAAHAGMRFALDFEDEFGDRWVTRSINLFSATFAADVESALEALPNNVIEDVEVSSVTANIDGRYFEVTFLNNSGDVPMLGGRFKFGNGQDAATANAAAVVQNTPEGHFPSSVFTIEEKTRGNKENVVCSNRGLCDYATGICKCFTGYTDFDCSVQNALSMG